MLPQDTSIVPDFKAWADHMGLATKGELVDAFEGMSEGEGGAPNPNAVNYKEFTYNGQKRKTIQLANYDSISGLDTKGTGHNLAMVSKWDVADFGAPNLHCNLNSKDGKVTINDNIEIATKPTTDDLQAKIDALTARVAALEAK